MALLASGHPSPQLSRASATLSSELEPHRFFPEKSAAQLEEGRSEGRYNVVKNRQAIISGAAYCVCSCSMVLLNKMVLTGYNLDAGISFMFYQNLVSVVIVYALKIYGSITTEPLTWQLVSIWFPVNLLFVGMLLSSIMSLKYMSIGMLTIMKNLASLSTAVGDMYLFRKRHNKQVWISLLLMLTMRKTMDLAKKATQSGNLNEYSMVLLNNTLSLPLGLSLAFVFNELQYLLNSSVVRLPMFWIVSTLTGFVGLAISFSSMWFLQQTGATTYSLVGSLNKVPISIAGILLFKAPISIPNLFSIFFGLVAGVMFARAQIS